jgi:hypothetical protein
MTVRRSLVVLAVAGALLAAHEVLLSLAARAHVAHALLGAGNAAPPVGPAALALALVVVRLLAIVVVPGAALAALSSLVAHVAVGPVEGGQAPTPRATATRMPDNGAP